MEYLLDNGASEQELAGFIEQPWPDIVGINCYVTSERFLDDRLSLYPPEWRYDNGCDQYRRGKCAGAGPTDRWIRGATVRASERYQLPVAITEVHMGCTRDEQLRWLYDAWRSAQSCVCKALTFVR